MEDFVDSSSVFTTNVNSKSVCERLSISPDLLSVELGAGAAVVRRLLPQVAGDVEDAHAHLLEATAGGGDHLLLLIRADVKVLVSGRQAASSAQSSTCTG